MKIPTEITTIFKDKAKSILHTGSRVICVPPPTDTDDDWLILVDKDDLHPLMIKLEDVYSYELGGSIPVDEKTLKYNHFWSFIKDELNIIITSDRDFFERFKQATKETKKKNLLNKKERIKFFASILYPIITIDKNYKRDKNNNLYEVNV